MKKIKIKSLIVIAIATRMIFIIFFNGLVGRGRIVRRMFSVSLLEHQRSYSRSTYPRYHFAMRFHFMARIKISCF